jgi:4'-phosphopantetheinyl transferase
LELIEPRTAAFTADYFIYEEQALVASCPGREHELLAVLWSAKESALKAMQIGLRVDTRSLYVTLQESEVAGWRALRVRYLQEHAFEGWWQADGQFVRTLVAEPAPECPISLRPLNHLTPQLLDSVLPSEREAWR